MNGVFDGAGREPYDQVWSKDDDVSSVAIVPPHFKTFWEFEAIIERCAEKFDALGLNQPRALRRPRHANNLIALTGLVAEAAQRVDALRGMRSRTSLLTQDGLKAANVAVDNAGHLVDQARGMVNHPPMTDNHVIQMTQDVEDIIFHLDLLTAALTSPLENLGDMAARYAVSDHLAVSFLLQGCPLG